MYVSSFAVGGKRAGASGRRRSWSSRGRCLATIGSAWPPPARPDPGPRPVIDPTDPRRRL